jgi:hypothetical protein
LKSAGSWLIIFVLDFQLLLFDKIPRVANNVSASLQY